MAATGLSKGLPNPNDYNKSAQKKNNKTVSLEQINGAMVIDRSLADPNYLLGMYGSQNAVDVIMGVK